MVRQTILVCLAAVLLTTGFARAELIQHLDARVSGSVTGNPVTQWDDQSGSAVDYDATPDVGSVYYPSTSLSASGLAGLDFGAAQNSLVLFSASDSDSWLDFSATGAAKDNTGFAVLVAVKCDSLNTDWSDLIGNSSAVASGFGFRYSNVGVMQFYLGGVSYNKTGLSVAAGDTIVFGFNYNAGTGVFALWDSKNNSGQNKTIAKQDFSLSSAVTLGSTASASRFIKGMVGEVKVYNAWLDNTQFATERDALVAKWITGLEITDESPADGGWAFVDTDLSWIFSGTAVSYDVYFDTTNPPTTLLKDDITVASVANADLPTLVDGTTYYWKVVENGSSTVSDVYRFTAAAIHNVITPTVATASEEAQADTYPGRWAAANLIDGSGLTDDGSVQEWTHAVTDGLANNSWTTSPLTVDDQWVKFELDGLYDLTGAYLWNWNQDITIGRGIDEFEIWVSDDDITYTQIGTTYNLDEAGGAAGEPGQRVAFTASAVKYVLFDVNTVHQGVAEYNAGLSEVRFTGDFVPDEDPPTPDPATFATAPYAIGKSISMTATTGVDVSGSVEYYFDETSGNPGGSDSGWQTSPSYTDSGLTADLEYTYTVQMRDAQDNYGTVSSPASATASEIFVLTPTGATASSYYNLILGPTYTINDSGLVYVDPADIATWTHTTDGENYMWRSGSGQTVGTDSVWAKYDLGATYNLTSAYIWNGNRPDGMGLDRGINEFEIWVSADDTTYTQIGTTYTLAIASGTNDETAQTVAFTADAVRYVKVEILSNHSGGADPSVMVSEVRFAGTEVDPTFFGQSPAEGAWAFDYTDLEWSYIGPDSTFDVYFGTDFNDVNDMLGSVQVADDIAIEKVYNVFLGTLENGTTYYWKVLQNDASYESSVFSFTVSSVYDVVTPIKATASEYNSMSSYGPLKTINGDGLDVKDGPVQGWTHVAPAVDTYWSTVNEVTVDDQWIQFDLGGIYDLTGAYIWNYVSDTSTECVDEFEIWASLDGVIWDPIGGTYNLARPTAVPSLPQWVPFAATGYQYVKFDINSVYGGAAVGIPGLAEVRFTGERLPQYDYLNDGDVDIDDLQRFADMWLNEGWWEVPASILIDDFGSYVALPGTPNVTDNWQMTDDGSIDVAGGAMVMTYDFTVVNEADWAGAHANYIFDGGPWDMSGFNTLKFRYYCEAGNSHEDYLYVKALNSDATGTLSPEFYVRVDTWDQLTTDGEPGWITVEVDLAATGLDLTAIGGIQLGLSSHPVVPNPGSDPDFAGERGSGVVKWDDVEFLNTVCSLEGDNARSDANNDCRTTLEDFSILADEWLMGTPGGDHLNVILIMTDDQGYGDLAAHGCSKSRTPQMDALHDRGIRFDNFHVAPYCAPTRASLMTGRMPDRTGVTRTYSERNNLSSEEVIMPEFFKASGYRTGIFGKWHLGGNFPYRPMDRGFDEWFGLGNGGLATTSDFWGNDRLNDTYWHNGQLVQRDGFCTDLYFDEAMEFIEESKNARKPFFAYIATNVPHFDWNVKQEWLDNFPSAASQQQAAFYASVERADWNIGRLVDFLKARGLSKNTVIVFLTDNGSDNPNPAAANTAGMRGKKASVYEGGHRVPCFLVGPASVVGMPRSINALAAGMDLLPTFVDICGLQQPQRQHLPWDGRSLLPLLQNPEQTEVDPDRTMFLHFFNNVDQPVKTAPSVVMTPQWRLVNRAELYDIKADPGQQTNVAGAYPGIVRDLKARYDAFWIEAELSTRQPVYPQLTQKGLVLAPIDSTLGQPIMQQKVSVGDNTPGTWHIDVQEAGRYRFELRRWPREAEAPIAGVPSPVVVHPELCYPNANTPLKNFRALSIAEATFKLSGHPQRSKDVSAEDTHVTFEADLQAGVTLVNAQFLNAQGKRLTGAYYVYVTRKNQ